MTAGIPPARGGPLLAFCGWRLLGGLLGLGLDGGSLLTFDGPCRRRGRQFRDGGWWRDYGCCDGGIVAIGPATSGTGIVIAGAGDAVTTFDTGARSEALAADR